MKIFLACMAILLVMGYRHVPMWMPTTMLSLWILYSLYHVVIWAKANWYQRMQLFSQENAIAVFYVSVIMGTLSYLVEASFATTYGRDFDLTQWAIRTVYMSILGSVIVITWNMTTK